MGVLLTSSAVLHLVAIPVSLVLLTVLVSASVGRPVSLFELFAVEPVLLWAGIILQFFFALRAATAARLAYRHRPGFAGGSIATGVLASFMSLALFGGVPGLVGGVLSVVGGALGIAARNQAHRDSVADRNIP